jgi:hypothetical protein
MKGVSLDGTWSQLPDPVQNKDWTTFGSVSIIYISSQEEGPSRQTIRATPKTSRPVNTENFRPNLPCKEVSADELKIRL